MTCISVLAYAALDSYYNMSFRICAFSSAVFLPLLLRLRIACYSFLVMSGAFNIDCILSSVSLVLCLVKLTCRQRCCSFLSITCITEGQQAMVFCFWIVSSIVWLIVPHLTSLHRDKHLHYSMLWVALTADNAICLLSESLDLHPITALDYIWAHCSVPVTLWKTEA